MITILRSARTACLAGLLLTSGCVFRSGPEALPAQPTVPGNPATAPQSTVLPATASPGSLPEKDPVQARLARMPLEEKIGQMVLAGIDGTLLDADAKRMIASRRVGGIILYADNLTGLDGMISLINALKSANAGAPAPLFISVDQEGGRVSRLPKEYLSLPSNAAVGRTGSAELSGEMGKLLGRELRSAGFNMNFAPVLDVNSNPANPVIGDRSFGRTADLVTRLGIAEMKGLRSAGVIPVVKHYPGHGDTSVDSHLELPVVDKTAAQLKQLEWLPFEAAVKEEAEAVMVAHIRFPKLDPHMPASLSEVIIGQELRSRMGYEGVVITDDLVMGAIAKHYDLAEAAVRTVMAGSDILLVGHGYGHADTVFEALMQAVEKGTLTVKRIDESVSRILALKREYDLNDHAVPPPDLTGLNRDILDWKKRVQP